jgi:HSP20 family molecular chaperone IbpA
VPGVEPREVHAELAGGTLVVSGARAREDGAEHRHLHAELPRGPFRRELRLPFPTSGPPRVDVDRGVIRVRLTRRASLPRA